MSAGARASSALDSLAVLGTRVTMSARVQQGWLQACWNCEDDYLGVFQMGAGLRWRAARLWEGCCKSSRAAYTARLPHRGLALIPALPQNISGRVVLSKHGPAFGSHGALFLDIDRPKLCIAWLGRAAFSPRRTSSRALSRQAPFGPPHVGRTEFVSSVCSLVS